MVLKKDKKQFRQLRNRWFKTKDEYLQKKGQIIEKYRDFEKNLISKEYWEKKLKEDDE